MVRITLITKLLPMPFFNATATGGNNIAKITRSNLFSFILKIITGRAFHNKLYPAEVLPIDKSEVMAHGAAMKLAFALLSLTCFTALAAPAVATAPAKTAPDPTHAPLPTITPPTDADYQKAITRGVDFLIADQNKNGSWGSATRTKGLNIYAPVPEAHLAFRAGASGLALAGLIDSGDRRPETRAAIEKGEKWFFAELPKLRQINPRAIYNVWGHSYGLHALCALNRYYNGDAEKKEALKKLAATQITALQKIEQVDGGWGYLDLDDQITAHPSGITTSFTTATVLLALHETRETFDLTMPDKEIKRGLRSIEQQRTGDWSFVYSLGHARRPRIPINRPAGSLGRSPACGTAMRKFGDSRVTDELMESWLHRLVLREGWFSIARKRPQPHDIHFNISGYFYYYGFYYATESLQMLPVADQKKYAPQLAHLLMEKQEKDGSWWDYPLYDYHQPYGTGYTLTALARLRAMK